MASHTMTPARRAALKKAQIASARKRRGKGNGKLAAAHRRARRNGRIAGAVGIGAAVGLVAYSVHQGVKTHKRRSAVAKVNVYHKNNAFNKATNNAFTDFGKTHKPKVKHHPYKPRTTTKKRLSVQPKYSKGRPRGTVTSNGLRWKRGVNYGGLKFR